MIPQHHRVCEFWTDHYPSDCSCGATMPKAPWFDTYAQACADAVEQQRREREEGEA